MMDRLVSASRVPTVVEAEADALGRLYEEHTRGLLN
jgi:hypothetical protein